MTLPPFALAQDDDDDVYLTTTSEVTFFWGLSLYVKMAILYDAGAHHLYRLWSNSNFSKQGKAAGQSNNCLNNNGKHTYLLLLLLLQSQLVLELNHSKCLSLQLQVPSQIIKQNFCTVAQIQSGQNKEGCIFSLGNLFLKIG